MADVGGIGVLGVCGMVMVNQEPVAIAVGLCVHVQSRWTLCLGAVGVHTGGCCGFTVLFLTPTTAKPLPCALLCLA